MDGTSPNVNSQKFNLSSTGDNIHAFQDDISEINQQNLIRELRANMELTKSQNNPQMFPIHEVNTIDKKFQIKKGKLPPVKKYLHIVQRHDIS